MSIKLGAFFPTRDMPPDRVAIRDWAQAAEGLGFDFLEVPDHVLGADRTALPDFEGPYDVNDSFHETFVTLAYLAGVTERVGLTSGVLILPQRQTALVAKQAAQLDVISGGRLRLGVGVGWSPEEYTTLGQDWHTRGRRQGEQVELMQRLWTETSVDFEGTTDRVVHLGINPRPIQRPIPVWFGGAADAVLARAARLGDGWIPQGDPDDQLKQRLEKLRKYLLENQRDPAAFGIEAWIRSSLGGADDWRRRAEEWAALGTTHLTLYTSGLGVGPVAQQIETLGRFHDALADLADG